MAQKTQIVKGQIINHFTILGEVEPRIVHKNTAKPYNVRRVKCLCDCGNIKILDLSSLLRGKTKSCGCWNKKVRHEAKKLVHGVGINDYDERIKINGKHILSYRKWLALLGRCYKESTLKRNPTYLGCSVCEEWKYFSKFKEWFDENYVDGYEIEKDILVKGNKVYSPPTCCFVPHKINSLFCKSNSTRGVYPIGVYYKKKQGIFVAVLQKGGKTQTEIGKYSNPDEAFNAYKQAKESYIKEVADGWKDKIASNVYEAMYNYKVEITD